MGLEIDGITVALREGMTEIMESTNFEMLRVKCPELAALGGFAEQYAVPDPSSALVKLRAYVESMVSRIYTAYGVPRPWQPTLNDLLNNQAFSSLIPPVVLDKFHAIRVHGNKAAHGEQQNTQKALWLLKEAYDLACWFFVTQCDGSTDNCPTYREVTPSALDGELEWNAKPERKAILEKLAAQEARMQELLLELEAQRAALQIAGKKVAEQEALRQVGQQVADALAFDEETIAGLHGEHSA